MAAAAAWRQAWQPPFRPVHLLACVTGVGVVAGAVLGAVLGSGYPPTLPFALVEGAFLVGVPAALVGGLAAGSWALVRRWSSRRR